MKKTVSPNTGQVWSVPVAVEDIPDSGMRIEIEAPPAARDQVARLAAVRELPRLSAVFDLTRRGAGVHVVGQVSARVGQNCVVSLEPVESDVVEQVGLLFAPLPADEGQPEGEIEVKLKAGEEPPEPLVDGAVDLGAIATEFLILGIDPYPRKAGAQFSAPKVEDDGAHPFAGLDALKKRLGGSQS